MVGYTLVCPRTLVEQLDLGCECMHAHICELDHATVALRQSALQFSLAAKPGRLVSYSTPVAMRSLVHSVIAKRITHLTLPVLADGIAPD